MEEASRFTTHDDRRRFDRTLFEPPLSATFDGHPAEILDLGWGGARVRHGRDLAVGQEGELTIEWYQPLLLRVRVNRAPADEAEQEWGLEIVHPSEELQRCILAHESEQEIARLRTLVEASKLINSSIEPDSLFESILTVARQELGVERGTLYFVDEKKGEIWAKIAAGLESAEIRLPIGKGLAGFVAETGEYVILHDAYADPRFDQTQDRRSGYRTRSMLCVPIRNRDGKTVGVLQLLNKQSGSFGQKDLDFLDSISDHMAIAMENATLHLDLLEKNRMERELQLGREIQARLLPPPPENVPGVDLAARSISCYEVGGDYYDFIELPDEQLGLAIGDVSGKGVAAALIMSSVQSALRMAAPIEPDLPKLIARLNSQLHRMTSGRKYATFFFARLDLRTGELRFVNAGHNPPFLARGNSLERLPSTGLPIGLMPEASYREASVILEPGSTLFLYTDGFNEANDPSEEELGMERWESIIRDHARGELAAIPDSIFHQVGRFEAGAAPIDDKTLVILRRTGAA